jgi:hypothetical protein
MKHDADSPLRNCGQLAFVDAGGNTSRRRTARCVVGRSRAQKYSSVVLPAPDFAGDATNGRFPLHVHAVLIVSPGIAATGRS